jgi:hypothetical protein
MFTNQAALTVLLLLFTFLCFISGSMAGAFVFALASLGSYMLGYLNGNSWSNIINKK